jgi:hypothetical protein
MPRQIITTPSPPSSSLDSQGIKSGSLVLVSGTTGLGAGADEAVCAGALWCPSRSLQPRC